MTKNNREDCTGVKADRKAPVGSHARSKDITDNFVYLAEAVKDTVGDHQWVDKNVGYAVYAGYDDAAQQAKGHKPGIVLINGTSQALVHLVVAMIEKMAEADKPKVPEELHEFLSVLIPGHERKKLDDMLADKMDNISKVKILMKIADALNVPFDIGTKDDDGNIISLNDLFNGKN